MYFLENQDETRNFATTYGSDIAPKKLIPKLLRAQSFAPDNDFELKSPITEPYQEKLYTRSNNERLPYKYRSANAEDYYTEMLNRRPHLKKLYPRDPPDEKIIEREKKNLWLSLYQISYNKDQGGIEEKIYVDLRKDSLIPQTVSTKTYRDPRYFGNVNFPEKKIFKPLDNIVVDNKEREILGIRTGDSEYQAMINKLGDRVMNEQFFGSPLPIDPPENPVKTSSNCSEILRHASKHHTLSQIM